MKDEDPMKVNAQASQEKLPSFLQERSAAWRAHPAFPRQRALLARLGIPHRQETTAGEASDLISKALAKQNKEQS